MKDIFKYEQSGLTLVGKLDPDGMKFFLDGSISPPREVPFEEILNQLLNHTKQSLIHEDVVRDVAHNLTKGEAVKERRVAKGVPPQPGADGKVIFLARRLELKGVHVAPKYLGTPLEIENIEVGRQVARVYKPKAGTPGMNALGKEIPAAAGKPTSVKWDAGLAVQTGEESYDLLVAQKGGILGEEKDQLSLLDVLSFDGDFDHRFGSVDFNGSIRVKGDVKTDSYLAGKKGVYVGGGVHAGVVIRSSEGPIEIKGAVNGGASSKFECAGNFICNALQQAEVDTKGDILITKEIHNARCRAQGKIVGEQAQLFAAAVYASGSVWIGKLGNAAGVHTVVHLCTDVETRAEYRELLRSIENHEKAEHMLELHLGPLVKTPERVVHLQSMHRVKVEALFKKYREVQKSKAALLAEKEEKLKTAVASEEMSVNVSKVLYPGVEITAGGAA